MRAGIDDRTGRAIIRDEALRLFATHGPDAVSMRQIAAEAGVSPGLIVHHFATKEGLREAVDRHVVDIFDRVLGELSAQAAPGPGGAGDVYDPAASSSLAEAMLAHLPPGSPVPAYVRRLLLAGGDTAAALFARLFEMATATLDAMVKAGMASPGRDPAVRAAFLMANDLAVLLLRDQLSGVLGFDPLSKAGMARWAPEMVAVYAHGLRGPSEDTPGGRG